MSSIHKDILMDQCEDLCSEAYDQGFKDCLKEVYNYLELWGGQDVLALKNALKYHMQRGFGYEYPSNPEEFE